MLWAVGRGRVRNSIFVAIAVAAVTLMWPHESHAAYVDPTTGGVLLQVVFGGLAGVAVIWKLFRHRIASIFFPRRLLRRLLRLPSGKVGAIGAGSSEGDEI